MNRSRLIHWLASGLPQLRRAVPGQRGANRRITRDHVIWAYRVLLDRDPEEEAVISDRLRHYATSQQLRADIMTSPEYRLKNPGNFPNTGEAGTVITEIDHELRLFVELSDLFIGQNIVRGCYEPDETAFVRRTVAPGHTVLDLGANIGFFTVIMGSLVGPLGRVYAFEPLDRNACLLQRSIAENGFQDRVTLERAAVGQVSGSARLVFQEYALNSGGSYLFEDGMEIPDGHRTQDVVTIALDDYDLRHPVRFIKIDVEGAEPLAIRGARRILRTDRPIILSELNAVALRRGAACTPGEFISEMRALDYDCYRLESGRPGDRISDRQDVSLCSVVFLPAAG